MSVSRPHPAACVADSDAPLIDERAATRGQSTRRVAMRVPA